MPLLLCRREMHCTEEHRAIDRIAHHELNWVAAIRWMAE
jgi:hypothetical protein